MTGALIPKGTSCRASPPSPIPTATSTATTVQSSTTRNTKIYTKIYTQFPNSCASRFHCASLAPATCDSRNYCASLAQASLLRLPAAGASRSPWSQPNSPPEPYRPPRTLGNIVLGPLGCPEDSGEVPEVPGGLPEPTKPSGSL